MSEKGTNGKLWYNYAANTNQVIRAGAFRCWVWSSSRINLIPSFKKPDTQYITRGTPEDSRKLAEYTRAIEDKALDIAAKETR